MVDTPPEVDFGALSMEDRCRIAMQLRDNLAFRTLMGELKADQMLNIVNSEPEEVAKRERAYSILKALDFIEGEVDALVAEGELAAIGGELGNG